MSDALWIVAVLGLMVALSEWLALHTAARHLGSALLVILLTAVVANLGIIPSVSDGSPVYDAIFGQVAPLAIFWLLLKVDLSSIRRAGGPMLAMFALGALGTMLGVYLGMRLTGGGKEFGDLAAPLAGMYTGTYIGGSVNFNAVALSYGVAREGVIYAGAAVVDNAATTVWMAATVVLPRFLAPLWRARYGLPRPGEGEAEHATETVGETVNATDLALLLALGAGTVWVSDALATWSAAAFGLPIPSILILTTLALLLAQSSLIRRIRGAYLAGWFAVMYFLAVIGALCDVHALAGAGHLGVHLLILVVTAIVVHGAVTFGGAALLKVDPEVAAVASQANIGGGPSAIALARSLERPDLVLPGVLVGTLGYAAGTYLGFLMAALLG